MKPFRTRTEGEALAQGDLIPSCHVPAFGEDFGTEGIEVELDVREADLIVVTQSCDLENNKISLAWISTEGN
jgi:hypothetical protein